MSALSRSADLRVSEHPDAARAPRLGVRARLLAAGLALGSLTMLLVGAALAPDAAGHGTHEQLGLLPCAWPMTMGIPCPTCGMTTAVSYAARGMLLDSFRTQPFGAALALVAACTIWIGGYVAATGSRMGLVAAVFLRPRVVWAVVGLLAASWGYKIAVWGT